MSYQIFSDSSCDFSPAMAKENNLFVVPFYVSFDGETYKKENVDMEIRSFYDQVVENPKVFPKTSLPSVQDYVDAFLPVARTGDDIICICISTKFSGSMQSALNAKEIVLESCPDVKIAVIDATVNTVLHGQYVFEALDMRNKSVPFEDAVAHLERIKSTGRIFFTVGNLEYLKHGGRIGKLSGIAGSVLGIKPLITLKEGEIFSSGLVRSRKKALDKMISLLTDYMKEVDARIEDYSFALGYGYNYDEAVSYRKYLVETLSETYAFKEEDFPIRQIGATIAVHTGPYAIGIGIIRHWNS